MPNLAMSPAMICEDMCVTYDVVKNYQVTTGSMPKHKGHGDVSSFRQQPETQWQYAHPLRRTNHYRGTPDKPHMHSRMKQN